MIRTLSRRLAWPALHAAALALAGLSAWSLATAAPARVEVRQANSSFAPGTLTLRAGTQVVFRNDDQLAHNVYSRTEGQAFNLGMAKPGESVERAFATPGTVDIRCAVHPRMRLTLTVEP
ncbi:cupredoxin domain-containing protein [Paracraurococcus lichenis]|uniref:Cupredoxin domain-containing protein n=1 Tax=Paracraurococcus lichenis TaxID=3064888 RepID=A0ABT9E401_9PROT|nr:cupredoxin domain-containing protein [Paracraurococcus sp. LOR1-02]MDO9710883.1 cupredoxin domain-containing protein [Paracraurococcus sp. LOR1-02]